MEFLYIEKHGQFFIVEELNLISMFHLLSPHMLGKMQGTTKAKVEVMLLCSCFMPSIDPYPEPWTRKYNIYQNQILDFDKKILSLSTI